MITLNLRTPDEIKSELVNGEKCFYVKTMKEDEVAILSDSVQFFWREFSPENEELRIVDFTEHEQEFILGDRIDKESSYMVLDWRINQYTSENVVGIEKESIFLEKISPFTFNENEILNKYDFPHTFKSLETIMNIDYSDFEDLILKHYGNSFSFVADNEASNDSTLHFGCYNESDNLESYEIEQIEDFRENGNYSMITDIFIRDLVQKDILPKNTEFQIEIYW